MIDKFQKLFGPNKTQSMTSSPESAFSGVACEEDDATRRMRNRHRLYGLIVLVLVVFLLSLWVMKPNSQYAKNAAEIQIPSIPQLSELPRVILQPKNSIALTTPEDVEKKPAAAKKPQSEIRKPTIKTSPKTPPVAKPAAKPAKAQTKPVEKTKAAAAKVATTVKQETKIKEAKSSETKVAKPKATKKSAASTVRKVGAKTYFIQVMAANSLPAAKTGVSRLKSLGLPVYIEKTTRGGTEFWRVRAGRFQTYTEARRALDKLELNGITNLGVMSEKTTKR